MLFVAAVVIRVWASGEARFTGDEAEQWGTARQIATFERAPIFGPAITGSPARLPGASYYYLAAVPQLLGASPRIGGIFIALLHVLAGVLIALLIKEARSTRAALVFFALFTFAPWDIFFGDRIWSACVTPLFGTFALYGAAKSRESGFWQGMTLALCLILPQLHFSAPMCWVACAVLLYLRPPVRWSKGWLAAGFAVAFATYAPVLVSEVMKDFENTRAILTYSGGKESVSYAALSPVKTALYAVVFGSADISYQLEKGYWGGHFDEISAYFTTWYWGRLPFFLSIAFALGGWVVAVLTTFPKLRKRELEAAMVAAILAGYAVGAILLAVSRKQFFPHYVALMLPAALFPIAVGLDRLRNAPLIAGCAATMALMAQQTIHYYRQVDALNGVNNTLAMVGAAVEEKGSIALRFDGYPNNYAWGEVARLYHQKPLNIDARGDIKLHVHNREPFEGSAVPEGGRLFGAVLMERSVFRPAGMIARASENLPAMRIRAAAPDKEPRACAPAATGCRYGDQPWQELRPELFELAGKKETLLFMHPIERGTVRAFVPVPKGARRGTLRYGLSDSATRSDNKTPVAVSLFVDEKNVAKGTAENVPGARVLPFVLTATAAEVSIEIFTEKDGARVFGFDVDFFD